MIGRRPHGSAHDWPRTRGAKPRAADDSSVTHDHVPPRVIPTIRSRLSRERSHDHMASYAIPASSWQEIALPRNLPGEPSRQLFLHFKKEQYIFNKLSQISYLRKSRGKLEREGPRTLPPPVPPVSQRCHSPATSVIDLEVRLPPPCSVAYLFLRSKICGDQFGICYSLLKCKKDVPGIYIE